MAALLQKPAPADDRSSETTAYDVSKYSHIIDWTHSSLLLFGRPVAIVSAEFQYFRVPDRERWLPLLIDIKGMGFNAVRVYIHWGYHCPAEGVYNFRGNRDIDYLFSICAQLELFVIVAPGPYICAEVQAGGFPIWLIAKRDLRVRHMAYPPLGMIKNWDQNWHDHCAQYMRLIVPMLVKWERTTNPNGCIIAMQIENELREKPMVGFGAVDNEIRLLCQIARDAGSTVPFFHNDFMPLGSWSAGAQYRSLATAGQKTSKRAYRTDLYGFDLYLTFPTGDRSGDLSSSQVGMIEACGISACLNCCGIGGTGVGGSDTPYLSCLYDSGRKHAPPPALGWADANQMEMTVDILGKLLNSFGGSARLAPSIVAEAQVGWINQWGRMRTYDDVYNFFGHDFSATLQNSLMAQGLMIVNHYTAYGGTNHGTVGDTEVYSSYDYSAFIREFGLTSRRGRVLRQSALFARSFADVGFSNSCPSQKYATKKSKSVVAIKTTIPSALIAVRDAVTLESSPVASRPRSSQIRSYAFLRNLRENLMRFSLIVDGMVLPCRLSKCESYIVPLYHDLNKSDMSIFACTVPVICRTTYNGAELWVIHVRKEEVGRLVLKRDKNNRHEQNAVKVKWAEIHCNDNKEEANSDKEMGEIIVSHADPGAATSIFSSPLEELPLSNHGSFAINEAPIGAKASTEEVGSCYSLSFLLEDACVAAVYDLKHDKSESLVLRLLCLNSVEADTFSADIAGNDSFSELVSRTFAAAWGVSNLTILPGGVLDVGCTHQDDQASVFALYDVDGEDVPEQFQSARPAAVSLLPGLWTQRVARNVFSAAVGHGITHGDPMSNNFEVPIENLEMRKVDWCEDVIWKEISYDNRDPLDHLMTSGHVTYRLRFRCSKTRGFLITNIRHSAVIWCNGKAVGSQLCFSHNVMSAGAMHAIDLHNAGKRRHDISEGLRRGPDVNNMHEIVILILGMGQSRSPFLLNDVRNKRGLLSARFSKLMGVKEMRIDIAGVNVTRTDDAYGSSGLPIEEEANTLSFDHGFSRVDDMMVKADHGLVYYRGQFKVPINCVVGGNVRYPLRLKVKSGAGVRAMIWVNTLFMGRYVEPLGPQTDFYIPEGLIKESKGNLLVIGVYGSADVNFSIQILPWVVDPSSGNLDQSNGSVFALRKSRFRLSLRKK